MINCPLRLLTLSAILLLGFAAPWCAAEPILAERDAWFGDTRGVLPRMATPPTVDGVIDPAEWKLAAEFNAQVTQLTYPAHVFYPRSVTWYLGWDDQNLYLAMRSLFAPNERLKCLARVSVGTAVMFDDTLEMWFDPKGRNEGKELASYFQSMLNGLGITYFCRLYPRVAARSEDWDPGWTIRSRTTTEAWEAEIRMPASGFALTRPNQSGDTWGMMLARNFMYQCWNQSPLAYQFTNFGFAVNSYYPLMTLSDSSPYVKFRHPAPVMDGRAFVDAVLLNPTRDAQSLTTHLLLTTPNAQAPVTLFERKDSVQVPAGGEFPYALNEPTQPPIDLTKSAQYRYAFTVTTAAGVEVFHVHFPFDPTKETAWRHPQFAEPKQLETRMSFNPVRFVAQSEIDVLNFPREADIATADTLVTDASGKVLADSHASRPLQHLYTDVIQLPVLSPGKYAWKTAVTLKDGTRLPAGEGTFEKKDEATAFAWWNAKIGDAEKVLWPYTPLVAEKGGQTLRAWGKLFRLDGLALPTQITVTGNTERWPAGRTGDPEVLAAPVRLEAVIGRKRVTLSASGKPKLESVLPHRVVLTGRAAAAGLRATTRTRLEQDGSYFVDLTLAPDRAGKPVTVDSLDLSLSVRAQVATFLNAYAHCGYSGYFIDRTPDQPVGGGPKTRRCTVWDPTLTSASSSVTVGDFIPQIWLGNEFRGLLWYADNDRGWTPTDGKHAQQIDREADRVILVHHLINLPTVVDQPRTISFVLQPTPQRPLQPGWRMLNVNFSQSFLPWDAMGRSGENYSAAVNLANDEAYAKSKAFTSRWPAYQSAEPNLAMYFTPHTETSAIMTTIWPDRAYFGSEWEGGSYTPTLNTHTLWWIDKWVREGGLQGLYHDQFSPHKITSVSTGLAYLLPDGRVQPGFALTTRRDFVMRERALWLEHGINPPRTQTHATNGGPLGCYGWIETAVDGEDKMINKDTPADFIDTWPSDRIRAGSLSYNWGVTFAFMRLFDPSGMTPEQVTRHNRAYAGHVLMHDMMNAWVTLNAWNNDPKSALLAWGMNDERVVFWPFWSNSDMVQSSVPDAKVSVWTLPDRVLLCVLNYSHADPAEKLTVTLDLKKLGVTLPPGASLRDAEEAAALPGLSPSGSKAVLSLAALAPRDYVLLALDEVK